MRLISIADVVNVTTGDCVRIRADRHTVIRKPQGQIVLSTSHTELAQKLRNPVEGDRSVDRLA